MTNLEYVTALVKSNDKIYIDTSALMNTEELELLAQNIQEILLAEEKHIIVPRAVCMELLRHLEGSDDRKRNIALKVFDIFCRYEKVFFVQNSAPGDVNFMRAFADAKLLAELTENKSSWKQLLITNDRKLGHDAYDLNNLESCKGHIIKVCYLNRFGELHRCDCVKDAQIQPTASEPEVVIREDVKDVTVKEEKAPESLVPKVIAPIATLLLGFAVGKYMDNAWRYIKKIA